MIHIPIEQRYDKRNQMFHSSAFAIAAGVVGVAGAAASAGMKMYSANKAAKAQGAASKKAQQQQNKALKEFQQGQARIEKDLGQVPMPVFNLGEDIAGARDISDFYRRQQELALGPNAALGRQEAYELGRQQLAELARMTAGEYSQADVQRLQRTAAESGIPINIQTAGKGMGVPQVGQAEFLRNLGMLPIQYKQMAFQYAPQVQNTMMGWVGAASNFLTAQPLDVSRMSLAYQMGGADVGLKKAGIRSDLLAAQFGAQTGISQRQYAMQQENIQTSLARDQALAQGVSDVSSALSSGVGGVGSAYGKLATAKAAAGGFNYGQTAFGAGGGSVGGMGTYGPNYGFPSAKV